MQERRGEEVKTPRYETEAALCADFIAWVKAEGGKLNRGVKTPTWTPYAETAGWDILLVAGDGTQIGVQAKLKFNMKVLSQSVPESWDHWHDRGPDYRAILVPEQDSAHANLCAALGLTMFHASGRAWPGRSSDFSPDLSMEHWNGGWHYWSPRERCELPEFVPDVIAGDSAPVQLTKWKIAALRIVATLEVRGHVTRQDFRGYGVDPRRWTGVGGWIKPGEQPGQFVRGDNLDFDRQHPEVYAKVLAEVRGKLATEIAP
jgi:hypothetical protein